MSQNNTDCQKRIYVTLNIANPEDKEVYDILCKKKNKNAYIRKAVLYFSKGTRLDLRTVEDIQTAVRDVMKEVLSGELPEVVTKEEPEEETSLPLQTLEQGEPEAANGEPDAEAESDEDDLDLSGFEDFFG